MKLHVGRINALEKAAAAKTAEEPILAAFLFELPDGPYTDAEGRAWTREEVDALEDRGALVLILELEPEPEALDASTEAPSVSDDAQARDTPPDAAE